jgi:hypothetical protein
VDFYGVVYFSLDESNLTTGEEIEIDEEKELSIVVDGQRSETDL